jgi:5'-AMP-activated protein kinase catalytic alpha subunit
MPSKLENYTLVKTLGQGAFSKVKLGIDSVTGKQFAIKIHKLDDPKLDQSCVDVVQNEIHTIKDLDHPNIVNLVNYIPRATVQKSNNTTYNVVCVIV